MAIFAISDLHVGFAENRRAVESIPHFPGDWLLLCGDVGETISHLEWALDALAPRFAQVVWTPGNHELWTRPEDGKTLRGVRKYLALVESCRARGVLTPEDPYPLWRGRDGTFRVAPLFLLYDYTFTPTPMSPEAALSWAIDGGVLCSDEAVLHPDPFPNRQAWCASRCDATARRLDEAVAADAHPLILLNHFPMRQAHADLPRLPAFSIWCGTTRTHDWPARYRAAVVVYGHLHRPRTHVEDGVRYEEVSLGYPGQWTTGVGALRRIAD